jgi:sialidase-1
MDSLTHKTFYYDPKYYCGWPSIVRANNGDLLVAFIRTEQHIAPCGSIITMRSKDDGATWAEPVVAYETPIDDRECGLTIMPDGRIIMHIYSTFWTEKLYNEFEANAYRSGIIPEWIKHVNTPEYKSQEHKGGSWTIVSSDDGQTWSKAKPGPDSVHGGITLQDGSLMIASYRSMTTHIDIYQTPDPDTPWTRITEVICPTPDTHRFGEPHIAQLPTGRIVVMIRYTQYVPQYDDTNDDQNLWQVYSDDNGHTWSDPVMTPIWGLPPHLLVLQDGRLLCSYSYRRAPYGERALISDDGVTWNITNEITLRDDNGNHDLGYPHSVEVAPGEILTVYYQKPDFDPADKHRYKTAMMSTQWKLPAN